MRRCNIFFPGEGRRRIRLNLPVNARRMIPLTNSTRKESTRCPTINPVRQELHERILQNVPYRKMRNMKI